MFDTDMEIVESDICLFLDCFIDCLCLKLLILLLVTISSNIASDTFVFFQNINCLCIKSYFLLIFFNLFSHSFTLCFNLWMFALAYILWTIAHLHLIFMKSSMKHFVWSVTFFSIFIYISHIFSWLHFLLSYLFGRNFSWI